MILKNILLKSCRCTECHAGHDRIDLNGSGPGIHTGGGAVPCGYAAGESYTLDHTAPGAPSALRVAAASDDGSSSSDGITSITTPAIEGNGVSGSTVILRDSNGIVDGDGHWRITVGAALSEGAHRITASQLDAAGNVSAASAALALTIGRNVPAPPPGTPALTCAATAMSW